MWPFTKLQSDQQWKQGIQPHGLARCKHYSPLPQSIPSLPLGVRRLHDIRWFAHTGIRSGLQLTSQTDEANVGWFKI
jgi:hypothetical protein